MREGLPVKFAVYFSWGLCLLISGFWLRSYFASDGFGKSVPGRMEGLDSYRGHIEWGVLTSNFPDWEGMASWRWQLELGQPSGGVLPGKGIWRYLVGGYYYHLRIANQFGMDQFVRGTRIEERRWWVMYHAIWIPAAIIPAIQLWGVLKRRRDSRWRGFPVGLRSDS